jgi:hypothetical protein
MISSSAASAPLPSALSGLVHENGLWHNFCGASTLRNR